MYQASEINRIEARFVDIAARRDKVAETIIEEGPNTARINPKEASEVSFIAQVSQIFAEAARSPGQDSRFPCSIIVAKNGPIASATGLIKGPKCCIFETLFATASLQRTLL